MNSKVSKWSLWWPVIVLAVLPLGVSYFKYPETHLPPGFGIFPPQFIPPGAPQFWLPYFIVIAILASLIVAVYLFPKLFGFKGGTPAEAPTGANKYPWWFYAGGVVMVISWYLMWARPQSLSGIVPFVFTPLWWGFIVFLDAIVYKRAGSSFMSKRFGLMIVCAIVSMVGWTFFEFFDYFVLESWYYPAVDVLPHWQTVIVFLIAYTTVWPAVFEWYNLLNTFPKFVARYQNGLTLNVNGKFMMILGYLMMVGMVIWPYMMYWAVWVGPTLVFIGIIKVAKISSPIDDLEVGNWSPVLLIMLSCILNGFIWEFWNHGSVSPFIWELFNSGSSGPVNPIMNPNFWQYDVAFVNVIHIFSEMPLLGYFGYMPFGILVWQFYIWAGEVFGFNSEITLDK